MPARGTLLLPYAVAEKLMGVPAFTVRLSGEIFIELVFGSGSAITTFADD
jgi:hypothetical protein